jgi:hypothetical protein
MVLLVFVVAGCDDGYPENLVATTTLPTQPRCDQATGRMGHWLPAFDRKQPHEATIVPVSVNPCLPFGDLIGKVDDLVPGTGEGAKDEARSAFRAFTGDVKRLAGYYVSADQALRCLYQEDELAIGIYRHTDHVSSVGVVIAINRDPRNAARAAACYLFGDSVLSDEPPTKAFHNSPCANMIRRTTDAVVLRFGTSNWMCDAIAHEVPKA